MNIALRAARLHRSVPGMSCKAPAVRGWTSATSMVPVVALQRVQPWPLPSRPVHLSGCWTAPGACLANSDVEVVGRRAIGSRNYGGQGILRCRLGCGDSARGRPAPPDTHPAPQLARGLLRLCRLALISTVFLRLSAKRGIYPRFFRPQARGSIPYSTRISASFAAAWKA